MINTGCLFTESAIVIATISIVFTDTDPEQIVHKSGHSKNITSKFYNTASFIVKSYTLIQIGDKTIHDKIRELKEEKKENLDISCRI